MLSNTLSAFSSTNSIDQNASCAPSTSSFIGPSESSNSAIEWRFSPPISEIINKNFTRTTTSTCLAPSNNSIINNYENSHHSSYSSLTHSSSDITSSIIPLSVVNPCYQSPIFLQEKNNTHSKTIHSRNEWDSSYENNTLRSLQNFPLDRLHHNNNNIQVQQYPTSTKRAFSLQMVPATFNGESITNIFCPISMVKCRQHNVINIKEEFYIENCSAASMDWLSETSLSRLTRLLELHSMDFATSNRWQKRIQRMMSITSFLRQIRAGKGHETISNTLTVPEQVNKLYGMPLNRMQANTVDGNPLPQFVRDIMEYIAGHAHLADGIFRKNGVNLRIQEIKECCSSLLPYQPIPQHLLYDSTIYDLGDSLKRYFRDLPECLFTDRLSEMLEDICNELPKEKHFTALQCCILLLPTPNREALMLLLKFLEGIARHSATNQMTCENLAICWFPSLFNFTSNPKVQNNGSMSALGRKLGRRKTIGITNGKEWKSFEAIKKILSKMIEDWERLLFLPKFLHNEIANNSSLEICHDLEIAIKNAQFDFSAELHRKFSRLLYRLKEDYFAGWKSWQLQRVFPDGTQLFVRSINDMIPLKSYRVQTYVAASTSFILTVILHGRNFWDSHVIECKRIGPSGQNFDIVKVQYRSTMDVLEKHAFLARKWTYSEFDDDSLCSVIECSIVPCFEKRHQQNCGNVSVFESKFLIKPIHHDNSLLTYISRIDLRGKSSRWYDTVYAEMLVNQIQRLKRRVYKYEFGGTIV